MDRVKKNWVLIAMALVIALLSAFSYITTSQLDRARNSSTAKDAQIQKLDRELGISESTLLEVSELNRKYKNEIDSFPKKLQDIIESYDLKIKSRDATIAALKNRSDGGTTVVEVIPPTEDAPQKIAYSWDDTLDRFHLKDPDIFTSNNETFSYKQYFSIKGYVLYGKNGKLQIRKVDIYEVVPKDDSFIPVPGGKMQVVDSTFEYADVGSNPKELIDIIHPRLLANLSAAAHVGTLSSSLRPGIGVEVANLGRYIDFANVGINLSFTPNLDDVIGGSLLSSRLGAGMAYTVVPPLVDSNFGIGMSISTPSNNLIKDWYVSVDGIFYLTN